MLSFHIAPLLSFDQELRSSYCHNNQKQEFCCWLWNRSRRGHFSRYSGATSKMHAWWHTDLEKTVKERVFHILHVAFSSRNRPMSDKVLPAEYWREEDCDWNNPRQADYDGNFPFCSPLLVTTMCHQPAYWSCFILRIHVTRKIGLQYYCLLEERD